MFLFYQSNKGIVIIFYLLWSFQTDCFNGFTNEDYQEFTETLCEGQCKQLNCPLNTVMKMQIIQVLSGKLENEDCVTIKRKDLILNDEDIWNDCWQMLQVEISSKSNSKCTNKSGCFICHRREHSKRYGRCTKSTATSISYICVSDQILEEVVPENTYIDLSCAHLIEHRIIIHKAKLIPVSQSNNFSAKNLSPYKNSTCSILDVSSTLSKKCSKKYKCQAGPNSLIPKGCTSQKLQLNYSCVPESILNLNNVYIRNSNLLQTKIQIKSTKQKSDNAIIRIQNRESYSSSNIDNTFDNIWIASLCSVIIVIVLTIIIMFCWCRSRHNLQNTSLSNKIRLANFSPPPTSIDKIEIDLACDNPMLPDPTISYHSQIRNDVLHPFQIGNDDIDFWNATVYPIDNIKVDIQSSSRSAGSSGKISTYHSETSKGNPNTVFNYITREKCSPDQTPL